MNATRLACPDAVATAARMTPSNTGVILSENPGMTTPQSQPPSDADRIIAAQREEGRKTRNLLVWIFIGIPVIGFVVWGLVALAGSGSPPATSPDTSISPTAAAGPLSLVSTCQELNDATNDELHDFDEAWPEVADEAAANCMAHPDWTINHAISPATP